MDHKAGKGKFADWSDALEALDQCACGSGRPLRECCLASDEFRLAVPSIGDLGMHPLNQMRNPRCYARSRRDCSPKLSREHYVSHAILRDIEGGASEPGVIASGLPWLRAGETKRFGSSSLASKVLCAQHNSQLSPLDATSLRIYAAIAEHRERRQERRHQFLFLNGHDVERICLKELCGSVAAGLVGRANGNRIAEHVRSGWVDILFTGSPFPAGAGLWFVAEAGHNSDQGARHRGFTSLVATHEERIVGGDLHFSGVFFFRLTLDPQLHEHVGESRQYRPSRIDLIDSTGATLTLGLSWADGHVGDTVSVRWSAKPSSA